MLRDAELNGNDLEEVLAQILTRYQEMLSPRRKPPQATYEEWYKHALAYFQENQHLRLGQAVFNHLAREQPDFCDWGLFVYTDVDPFHDDTRTPAFLAWVQANWNLRAK